MDFQSRLRLEHEPDPELEDAVVVRLAGALEVNGAAELWDLVSGEVAAGARFFLFDLSRLKILTSAGVGALVRLFVRLRPRGGAIAIHGCSDNVREVFTVVMLESTLGVCSTETQARQSLAAAAG